MRNFIEIAIAAIMVSLFAVTFWAPVAMAAVALPVY
jgi:hypothetical protein